ncbi:MAG: hypothetical protein MMC33_000317 [Icmadophila ericetorum]|nr:hypothetical protein [Icmadophila ericetorum]
MLLSSFDTQLPFLYQTTTLLRRRTPKSFLNQPRTFYTSTPCPTAYNVPLRLRRSDEEFRSSTDSERIRQSTITTAERAIFDRIFKNIYESTSTQQPETENEFDEDEDSGGDADQSWGPNETLEKIFDKATKDLHLSLEGHSDRNTDRLYQDQYVTSPFSFQKQRIVKYAELVDEKTTFRRPWLRTRYGFTPHQAQLLETEMGDYGSRSIHLHRSDEKFTIHKKYNRGFLRIGTPKVVNKRIESMIVVYLKKVSFKIKFAQTDFELWEVLEKEVFKKVEEMNEELRREQKDMKSPTESNYKRKGEVNEEVKEEVKEVQSLTLKIPPLLLLQRSYDLLCGYAMRHFRRNFPTSPYAIALLPHIKSLGSTSFALGASKNLYNELLYIRWVHYFDLEGVAGLVEEMVDFGIGTNALTLAILKDGNTYYRKARCGTLGPIHKVRLQLEGQKTGWLRWRQALERVRNAAQLKKDAALMEIERDWRELEEDEAAEARQAESAEQREDHQVEAEMDGEALPEASKETIAKLRDAREQLQRRRSEVEREYSRLIS